ncbi:MAG: hypothetical protein Q9168_001052 [Polycauliona sp. 1 TL-2023]
MPHTNPTNDINVQPPSHTSSPPPLTYDHDPDPDDPTPAPATVHINISAPTTIHGSHNRLVLPSPNHLSSLISVAVKLALQPAEEGELKEEDEQQTITVSVDAGTRIEGNGNIVIFDGRKDSRSIMGNDTKQRLSEPVDTEPSAKRVNTVGR